MGSLFPRQTPHSSIMQFTAPVTAAAHWEEGVRNGGVFFFFSEYQTSISVQLDSDQLVICNLSRSVLRLRRTWSDVRVFTVALRTWRLRDWVHTVVLKLGATWRLRNGWILKIQVQFNIMHTQAAPYGSICWRVWCSVPFHKILKLSNQ